MNKFVVGGVICVGVLLSHILIQSVTATKAEKDFAAKAVMLENAISMPVEASYSSVRFDYASFSVLIDGVTIDVGDNSVAAISIDSVKSSLFTNSSSISGFVALAPLATGGAISLVELKEGVFTTDQSGSIKSDKWSYADIQLNGLTLSDKFYAELLAEGALTLVEALVPEQGFDLSFKMTNPLREDLAAFEMSLRLPEQLKASFNTKYSLVDTVVSGTPVFDKPLENPRQVKYAVKEFTLDLVDEGARDTVFNWGGQLNPTPSIDDKNVFKANILEGLDTLVEQVLVEPMLPLDAMRDLVKFVDVGGAYKVHVDFEEPVAANLLWSHLMGYPQIGIYGSASVKSEVR